MGNVHDHGVQLVFNLQVKGLIDKAVCVLGTGQLFLEGMKAETVVDALVQNAAQFLVTLNDEDAVRACLLGGHCSSQAGGTAADDYDIIGKHSHYCAPPFVLSSTILESPPSFVIFSIGIPSSLLMISIVRGEQKPAWHLPMPARVLRLTPSRERAPRGLWMASMISPSVTDSQRQIMRP